ncbi:MAG: aldehyde ferredoxin oxidoreductase family protein [Thermodesulfovibrionales bacterium]|nr:aldehyde ferredoxin oxidoreductase family protein [Thermodesulfovibrionales bacterium]
MKGFFSKYLVIDLNNKKWYKEVLNEFELSLSLGGKGLAVDLLLKYQPAGIHPSSPENPLVFALGPVTDTYLYGSSRYGVYTKSPLTGFFCESYSGGKVPEKISKTGYDAILILGNCNELSYIYITPENVEILPASKLSGLSCYDTESLLNEKYPDSGIVTIGPAGEKGIPFSIISNDYWRCAGRAGAGAVMGNKNIKAIVFKGDKRREVAYLEDLKKFSQEILESKKEHPSTIAYKRFGTPMMVDLLNKVKAFPTRYWHKGFFEDYEKINAEAMQNKMEVKPKACAKCFMACGKLSIVKEGRHAGLKIEGPEYETIYAFGGLCMINDITEIAYLNDLCDRLGMDTITVGNLVALAMEASEKGKIKERVRYGNVEDAEKLILDISEIKGLGAILSQGIKKASKNLGMEDFAIHVKGLEPAGYDPRYLKGMGLSYAVSDRGACHLRTTFYKAELSGMISPDTIEKKVELLLDFEDRLTLFDSLIVCRFYRDFYLWDELSKIIKLTTGLDLNREDLKKLSSKINDTIRGYNIREGLTKQDDYLPERFHSEPLPETGAVITKDDFNKMLEEYYSYRGWNKKD